MTEDLVALTAETILKRPMTTRVRKFRGKLMLANSATAYELDEVAAFVVGRVDGRSSIATIAAKVVAQWDVDAEVAIADVLEMFALLVQNGLIVNTT